MRIPKAVGVFIVRTPSAAFVTDENNLHFVHFHDELNESGTPEFVLKEWVVMSSTRNFWSFDKISGRVGSQR